MAKVYLDSGDTFALSGAASVFGSTGTEKVVVNSGVTGVVVDANVERVDLPGASSAYTFQQAGNQLKVFSGTTVVATIPLQDDTDGTQVVFTNGSVSAKVGATGLTLGGATVPSTAAAAVTPTTIDATVTSGSGSSTGGTTTGQTFSLTTASDVKTLTGGNDTVDGAALDTLNSGDIIADASSTDSDVLNATISAAIAPTISNVETLNITDKFGGNTFTASGVSDGKIVIGSTYGFTEVVDTVDGAKITSVQGGDTITNLTVSTISNNAVINQNKVTSLTLGGKTADADAVTVKLSGVGLALADGSIADLKTINLQNTSGTASTVTLAANVVQDAAASIAVSGSSNVTLKASAADIENAATGLGAGISKAMTGSATFAVDLTTVGTADRDLTKVVADSFTVSSTTALGAKNITFAAGTTNLTLTKNVIDNTGGFSATGSATTDVLNLTETVLNTNLVTNGYETVNLTNSTGSAFSTTTTNVSTSGSLKVASAFDTTLGSATFKSVDATGLTGSAKLSLTAAAMSTDASVTTNGNAATVTFSGASGKYMITSGAGNDTITGGSGNDTVDSGAGNDSIDTGNGNNFVIAGDGDDSIVLGTGNDTVITGSGNNSVSVASDKWSTSDALQGGSGADTLYLTGTGGGTIAFAAGSASAFTGFEKIEATGVAGSTLSITFADGNVAAGSTFTFNASQTNTAAVAFDASADTDALFTLNVTSKHVTAANNALKTGALADTITFNGGTAGKASITAGKGADSITLTSTAVGSVINQAKGDSGVVTAVTSGMSVAQFDVVTGVASGDSVKLNYDLTWSSGVKTTAPTSLADGTIYQVQGTYNATTKTFAINGSGADSMLVYDADATASATQFEGIVLVGYTGNTTAATFASSAFTVA